MTKQDKLQKKLLGLADRIALTAKLIPQTDDMFGVHGVLVMIEAELAHVVDDVFDAAENTN